MNDKVIIFLSGVAVGMSISAPFMLNFFKEAKRCDEEHEESMARVTDDFYNAMTSIKQISREMSVTDDYSDTGTDHPHIITPEEFGEKEDYDTISLTLYSDGVVADDADKPIDDIDDVIGKGSLDHFGEYEDDSIFVRNDKLKCDYEVLIDEREYAQILEEKPYLKE